MWKLDRKLKILVIAATLWPLFYIFIFFVFLLLSVFFSKQYPNIPFFPQLTSLIMIAHFGTIILSIVMIVFYILDIMKNPGVPEGERAGWIVGLFLLGIIIMPFYWYLHIWKEPQPKPGTFTTPSQKI